MCVGPVKPLFWPMQRVYRNNNTHTTTLCAHREQPVFLATHTHTHAPMQRAYLHLHMRTNSYDWELLKGVKESSDWTTYARYHLKMACYILYWLMCTLLSEKHSKKMAFFWHVSFSSFFFFSSTVNTDKLPAGPAQLSCASQPNIVAGGR